MDIIPNHHDRRSTHFGMEGAKYSQRDNHRFHLFFASSFHFLIALHSHQSSSFCFSTGRITNCHFWVLVFMTFFLNWIFTSLFLSVVGFVISVCNYSWLLDLTRKKIKWCARSSLVSCVFSCTKWVMIISICYNWLMFWLLRQFYRHWWKRKWWLRQTDDDEHGQSNRLIWNGYK